MFRLLDFIIEAAIKLIASPPYRTGEWQLSVNKALEKYSRLVTTAQADLA